MGLGKLFNKKKHIDLSILEVDFHSHLIPGIDDGSKSIDESVELIRRMQHWGYKKIITTPHIMSDFYQNSPEIIENGLNELKHNLKNNNISIELEAAAEYMLDDGFEQKFKSGKLLTFSNNHILIEFSTLSAPYNLKQVLFDLQIAGYKIILAHPERYLYWYNDFTKYQDLKTRGIFFQLNMVSLCDFYSLAVRKNAIKLIRAGMIDFICTDLHNDNYVEAIEKCRSNRHLFELLSSNSIKNNVFLK